MKATRISKRNVFSVLSLVIALSVVFAGPVMAETTNVVNKTDLMSKGKFVHNDGITGNSTVIDSNDFSILGDAINQVNSESNTRIEELSSTIDSLAEKVAEGKVSIAQALTVSGITASNDASFETLAGNVTSMAADRYNTGVEYGEARAASRLYDKLNALNTEVNTLLSSTLKTTYAETDTIDTIADGIETTKNTLNESLNQVQTTLEDTKKSVADGKSLIASAITNKGVITAADADFQTMANNITTMATKQYNAGYSSASNNSYKLATIVTNNNLYFGTQSWYIGNIVPSYSTLNSSNFIINLNSVQLMTSGANGNTYYFGISYNPSNGYVTVTGNQSDTIPIFDLYVKYH